MKTEVPSNDIKNQCNVIAVVCEVTANGVFYSFEFYYSRFPEKNEIKGYKP